MELTGKCKEDFEKRYLDDSTEEDLWNHNNVLTDSEKYGVLVDYFDSVDVYIEILKHLTEQLYYYYIINNGDQENRFKTRLDARTASIEEANYLRNKQLNK
tara:strand:- start:584 stop:886 length:303 start_codon:yes stop_codon:yes gene_type:complete